MQRAPPRDGSGIRRSRSTARAGSVSHPLQYRPRNFVSVSESNPLSKTPGLSSQETLKYESLELRALGMMNNGYREKNKL